MKNNFQTDATTENQGTLLPRRGYVYLHDEEWLDEIDPEWQTKLTDSLNFHCQSSSFRDEPWCEACSEKVVEYLNQQYAKQYGDDEFAIAQLDNDPCDDTPAICSVCTCDVCSKCNDFPDELEWGFIETEEDLEIWWEWHNAQESMRFARRSARAEHEGTEEPWKDVCDHYRAEQYEPFLREREAALERLKNNLPLWPEHERKS